MTRIILVSHNQLAPGMKAAVEMIAGPQANLEAYGLMPGDQPETIIHAIKTTITADQDVLVLADIVGGSMCNAAMKLLNLPNVRLVGGMNLALVLQIVLAPPTDAAALAHVIDQAQASLHPVIIQQTSDDDFFLSR
ncbi:MAG: PTS mannose transporter subunit IIA [Lactobacillus sp.]|uniref:PTS sugar transporter subunit IIA n=1 Tax=Lacticaseibacillus suilingensis TaxID=2799577 RepID=A0ABW4BGE2_9LACO|nr:PTS mannose transporter subunit IIA [Lacticaseibacillus suilingensis]MCI1894363.1 PTS mannose transporter subunit IIA [Lactobacillus sp.]MCI1917292.1 PTS mannose transporter subunit IIA [Lactobacillus sp.]MCI1941075.1 PTS mannose transporter subunit IIA [Lactobacillus sp.]MCI1971618.1 PTS mannose transporter subunit IIA [Lactobacillus sp.]MCI2017532.1 PTS mannose transporter subunit IIA [Lactobacillus sp.]